MMKTKIFCAVLCIAVLPTSVQASCGERPGTPKNVKGRALSATQIQFEFTNTTGKRGFALTGVKIEDRQVFFDIFLRDGNKKSIGRDLAGIRLEQSGAYGEGTYYEATGLSPKTTYCFALRARTEGGTQGCVSAQTSNWACTTTLAR